MERGSFGSRLGIVLATAGSAVGLGNVWRFPYMTGQNGGAAFIIIYLACILILGIPGMVSEFIVGRHSQTNAARAYARFSRGKAWGFVGILGIITSTIILGFYAVVAGWCLHYLGASAIGQLKGDTDFVQQYFLTFSGDPVKPAILGIVFILITHFIIVRGVRNGIEKASKLLMPLLFILLLILVIASCSLPDASRGIKFLLKPDFTKVTPKVFLEALGQAFFSLSLGMGCLCTYASYFDTTTPLGKTAIHVSVIDTLIAILAGFIIFPSVFNIGMNPNEVGVGASLTFISLPNVFQQALGEGSLMSIIFSALFYFLLFVAALTSAISLHEVATAYVTEEFNMTRNRGASLVTIVVLVLGTLCSLSFGPLSNIKILDRNIFSMFDDLSGVILLPIGVMFISLFAGWRLDKELYRNEISNHGDIETPYFKMLIFSLRFMIPLAILLVFLDQLGLFKAIFK